MSFVVGGSGCPAGPVMSTSEGFEALPRLRPSGLDLCGCLGSFRGQTGRKEAPWVSSEIRPRLRPFGAVAVDAETTFGFARRVFPGTGPQDPAPLPGAAWLRPQKLRLARTR